MNSLHRLRSLTSQRVVNVLAVLMCSSFASAAFAADHGNKALSAAGPAARPTLEQLREKNDACPQGAESSGSCVDPALLKERERELQQLALHAALVDSSVFGQLRVLREPVVKQSALGKKSKRNRDDQDCVPLK